MLVMNQISDTVLDHYRNPRNAGELDDADVEAEVENAACGDSMQLFARIDRGIVVDASCRTFGCAPSVAAGSVLTELLRGKALDDIEHLQPADVEKALGGLPQMKHHAAQLATAAARSLIANYRGES